jgi:hypothetical protein
MKLLKNKILLTVLLGVSGLIPLLSPVLTVTVQANSQDCFAWVFNCKDKPADKAIKDIYKDIDLDETKNLSQDKQNEITALLSSTDKSKVEKGFEELFNVSVKNDFNLYIQGKATKDNTTRLRKFYDGINSARKPLEREWSPMVNSWGLLNNGVSFGSFIVSSLFLDIQTQLPDVFGKFDYKEQKPVQEKAKEAFSLDTGGKLKLDSIQTIDLNKIYYQLLALTIPFFSLYMLIKYATKGWYDWEVVTKMIMEVFVFLLFVVLAPSLVSGTTLLTNTSTMAMQQTFSSSNVVDVCKDDRTMLCAYKASFNAQANREAIFARSNQFYTFEEDGLKSIGNLIGEIFTSFIPLALYTLNVIFGLLVLMFWKGAVLLLLITMIFLTILLPFALINPSWRLRWFNKMLMLQITVFGFTLVFNLATQLVLSISTGGFAFWSISFVFLIASFLIFQAMPLISEIFGINVSFRLNPERSIRNTAGLEVERLRSKSGYNQIRRGVKSKYGETPLYKKATQAKTFVRNFGKKSIGKR